MRILVTGASGFVGHVVAQQFEALSDVAVMGTFLSNPHTGCSHNKYLDLTDGQSVLALVSEFRPDVIIHAATSHKSINSIQPATSHIVEAANQTRSHLIAFSTDMIFDGTLPPYPEDAIAAPLSDYGRAKATADAHIQAESSSYCLVRTSLVYDFSEQSPQMKWMLQRINAGETVSLFSDEIRQPIWVNNLGEAIIDLAQQGLAQTINIAGPIALTRYEFGTRLLEFSGHDAKRHVRSVSIADSGMTRPKDCRLDLTKAKQLLTTKLLEVNEAYAAYDKLRNDPRQRTAH